MECDKHGWHGGYVCSKCELADIERERDRQSERDREEAQERREREAKARAEREAREEREAAAREREANDRLREAEARYEREREEQRERHAENVRLQEERAARQEEHNQAVLYAQEEAAAELRRQGELAQLHREKSREFDTEKDIDASVEMLRVKQIAQAKLLAERAVQRTPAYPAAYFQLARCERAEGRDAKPTVDTGMSLAVGDGAAAERSARVTWLVKGVEGVPVPPEAARLLRGLVNPRSANRWHRGTPRGALAAAFVFDVWDLHDLIAARWVDAMCSDSFGIDADTDRGRAALGLLSLSSVSAAIQLMYGFGDQMTAGQVEWFRDRFIASGRPELLERLKRWLEVLIRESAIGHVEALAALASRSEATEDWALHAAEQARSARVEVERAFGMRGASLDLHAKQEALFRVVDELDALVDEVDQPRAALRAELADLRRSVEANANRLGLLRSEQQTRAASYGAQWKTLAALAIPVSILAFCCTCFMSHATTSNRGDDAVLAGKVVGLVVLGCFGAAIYMLHPKADGASRDTEIGFLVATDQSQRERVATLESSLAAKNREPCWQTLDALQETRSQWQRYRR